MRDAKFETYGHTEIEGVTQCEKQSFAWLPLETNLIGASPELAYNAIQSTSTANKLVNISQTAVQELSSLSVEQATGNSDKTVNSYVGQTGRIV